MSFSSINMTNLPIMLEHLSLHRDCSCSIFKMLSSIIANFEPIRRNMLQMLKPTEIVALWTATKFNITYFEKQAYLSWTRENFAGECELNQLRSNGRVTVIGKDLNTSTQAIRSLKYRPGGLRLLVVVKHPTLNPQPHFEKCQSFSNL